MNLLERDWHDQMTSLFREKVLLCQELCHSHFDTCSLEIAFNVQCQDGCYAVTRKECGNQPIASGVFGNMSIGRPSRSRKKYTIGDMALFDRPCTVTPLPTLKPDNDRSQDPGMAHHVPTMATNDNKKVARGTPLSSDLLDPLEYSQEELLYYAKCFHSTRSPTMLNMTDPLTTLKQLPSVIIRYGVLFPARLSLLSLSTCAFFTSLPVAVVLNSKEGVSWLVKYYCKSILWSLGVVPRYLGDKPSLKEPHIFVANHTSYLDYIVLSAHKFPSAVVMARHNGALGFLQNNGLNYLNSMTFDRSSMDERKELAEKVRQHVINPETWPNPMIMFPEGTCVNNHYTIRFQKGAFSMGVKVCPVGIRYDKTWGDPYWDTRHGFISYALYRMTRWISPVDVVYLEPDEKRPEEDVLSFSRRVKMAISKSVGLKSEEFNGLAKPRVLALLENTEHR